MNEQDTELVYSYQDNRTDDVLVQQLYYQHNNRMLCPNSWILAYLQPYMII